MPKGVALSDSILVIQLMFKIKFLYVFVVKRNLDRKFYLMTKQMAISHFHFLNENPKRDCYILLRVAVSLQLPADLQKNIHSKVAICVWTSCWKLPEFTDNFNWIWEFQEVIQSCCKFFTSSRFQFLAFRFDSESPFVLQLNFRIAFFSCDAGSAAN